MIRAMLKSALIVLLAAFASCEQNNIKEKNLREYDGTDPDKPIYLAIDGKIYDVSASPNFYGPGGHYHHFTGRDASRAVSILGARVVIEDSSSCNAIF